jgi:hypothetical protein
VLKTSSSKIGRAACRKLYERGHIGHSKPAVWLQLLRMGLAGIAPMPVRLANVAGAWLYAGYCWLCLGAVGAMTWLGLQVCCRAATAAEGWPIMGFGCWFE